MVRGSRLTLVAAALLALAYAVAVCMQGVPVLRHDWWWPSNHEMALETFVDSTSGWIPSGIGMPQAYPGGYIVGPIIALLTLVAGGLASLLVFAFAAAVTATLGARELGKHFGANACSVIAAEAFALFNPWVYNETVAGHLYMILAYAACIAMAAELLRPRVQARRMGLLLILILPQLQLFLVAMIFIAVHALLRRVALPFVSGIVYGLPIWIGIALDRGTLLKMPYTAVWQASQSVPISDAVALHGYFAHYAEFGGAGRSAMWVIVGCAASAALLRERKTLALICIAIGILLILIASGTEGPFSSAYTYLVLNVPETAVFRELYDLIGFVAIMYLILLTCQPAKSLVVPIVSVVAAAILATVWITNPVSNYWVSRSALPAVDVRAEANTRFALVPAYEPMQFHGKGSGADPDSYLRRSNATPVNEYFARYPVTAALSSYLLNGDVRPLENLSVSVIVTRPWLETNAEALRHEISGVIQATAAQVPMETRMLRPLPEVTLMDMPAVGSLVNRLGAGNIFFDDARRVRSPLAPRSWSAYPTFLPETAPSRFVDEANGWVDAEFTFAAHPDLGEGLGGLVTSNPGALLRVVPGLPALVNVRGQLLDAKSSEVSADTQGYTWIRIPKGVDLLRCNGRCVVVGQMQMTAHIPLNPVPRSYVAASFETLTPWLVRVSVPADSPPLLRYNVAYDDSWMAVAGAERTAHIRLDATINGWLLKKNIHPYTVYLLQRAAVAQCACELIAVFWLAVLAWQSFVVAARLLRSID